MKMKVVKCDDCHTELGKLIDNQIGGKVTIRVKCPVCGEETYKLPVHGKWNFITNKRYCMSDIQDDLIILE